MRENISVMLLVMALALIPIASLAESETSVKNTYIDTRDGVDIYIGTKSEIEFLNSNNFSVDIGYFLTYTCEDSRLPMERTGFIRWIKPDKHFVIEKTDFSCSPDRDIRLHKINIRVLRSR